MDQFIANSKSAFNSKNGLKLAEILQLPVCAAQADFTEIDALMVKFDAGDISALAQQYQRLLKNEHIANMVVQRLNVIFHIKGCSWTIAVDSSLSMYNSLLEYLREDNTSWILPVLVRLSNDVRLLAVVVCFLFFSN
jgi:hypothetical protein